MNNEDADYWASEVYGARKRWKKKGRGWPVTTFIFSESCITQSCSGLTDEDIERAVNMGMPEIKSMILSRAKEAQQE